MTGGQTVSPAAKRFDRLGRRFLFLPPPDGSNRPPGRAGPAAGRRRPFLAPCRTLAEGPKRAEGRPGGRLGRPCLASVPLLAAGQGTRARFDQWSKSVQAVKTGVVKTGVLTSGQRMARGRWAKGAAGLSAKGRPAGPRVDSGRRLTTRPRLTTQKCLWTSGRTIFCPRAKLSSGHRRLSHALPTGHGRPCPGEDHWSHYPLPTGQALVRTPPALTTGQGRPCRATTSPARPASRDTALTTGQTMTTGPTSFDP